MAQVALLSIDTASGDEPNVDNLLLFPDRESAIQKFIDDFGPDGEYADIDAVGRDFDQLVNDLRNTGVADTGEDRIYVLKEVDA